MTEGKELAVAGDSLLDLFVADTRSTITDDPEEVQRAILERILSAQTVEEAFSRQEAWKARDTLGQVLEVRGVRWLESSFESGPGIFAALDVVKLDTGECGVLTCGGVNVLGQLYKAWQLKALPLRLRFRQVEKATRAGYHPLWLELVQ